jgi:hypothetical protein
MSEATYYTILSCERIQRLVPLFKDIPTWGIVEWSTAPLYLFIYPWLWVYDTTVGLMINLAVNHQDELYTIGLNTDLEWLQQLSWSLVGDPTNTISAVGWIATFLATPFIIYGYRILVAVCKRLMNGKNGERKGIW